ncbi:hypothetical protein PILCRDRAFT_827094 [Piloderma croceum F 1598]|uniref:Uncharacterized protein n=1 Tax=Piloderma croceum (strain F 1598) TaxID=765440 RepID=A0A0C3F773_PILCF|nr:hypothetical protein PILCRDRAFT_827094 [Piloderma croceum F 1598]
MVLASTVTDSGRPINDEVKVCRCLMEMDAKFLCDSCQFRGGGAWDTMALQILPLRARPLRCQ